MKYSLLLAFALAASATSAFAAPTYLCQPSDSDLAPLKVFVESKDKVAFATIVDGKQVPETILERKDSLSPGQGYSAFFAVGGCNQDGKGPHCFALWQNTLILSNDMLRGVERGSVKLNSEAYRCEISAN